MVGKGLCGSVNAEKASSNHYLLALLTLFGEGAEGVKQVGPLSDLLPPAPKYRVYISIEGGLKVIVRPTNWVIGVREPISAIHTGFSDPQRLVADLFAPVLDVVIDMNFGTSNL